MKKGIIIVKGCSLEPPYTMRQEADKIFINEKMVYPFEVEKPKKKLVLDTDHFYMDEYPTLINLVSQNIRKFFEKVFPK